MCCAIHSQLPYLSSVLFKPAIQLTSRGDVYNTYMSGRELTHEFS